MKVLQKLKGLIVLTCAFACVTVLLANEVTPEQARTAAGNWIKLGSTRMDSEFRSRGVKSMKTARSDTGRAIYHAVNLDGGGFVVTTGDTRLPPIIAFSAEGQFSDDETRPFHALLLKSLSRAVSSLERSDHMAAASSGGAKAGETQILHLLLLLAGEGNAGELGDALHDLGHVAAESLRHLLVGDAGILDHVVQQPGHDGFFIQAHLRNDLGRGQGMRDVK